MEACSWLGENIKRDTQGKNPFKTLKKYLDFLTPQFKMERLSAGHFQFLSFDRDALVTEWLRVAA